MAAATQEIRRELAAEDRTLENKQLGVCETIVETLFRKHN